MPTTRWAAILLVRRYMNAAIEVAGGCLLGTKITSFSSTSTIWVRNRTRALRTDAVSLLTGAATEEPKAFSNQLRNLSTIHIVVCLQGAVGHVASVWDLNGSSREGHCAGHLDTGQRAEVHTGKRPPLPALSHSPTARSKVEWGRH